MNRTEAKNAWVAEKGRLEELGIILPGAESYLPDEYRRNFALAMDAQPALTTAPNGAIPAWLTMFVDPDAVRILFSPNNATKILGEAKKGSWITDTAMFTVVEHGGEVSSYDDWVENGNATVNTNFPQRQAYHFQTMIRYGDREIERAGLTRLNWVSEKEAAATTIMDKFQNVSYFFGVRGLQNYGLLNNPYNPASISPSTKAAGGTTWFVNGLPNATANECYNDIVALFENAITRLGGSVTVKDKCTLAMSPGSEVALGFTNAFGINLGDLLKKNYPGLTVETAVQYGVQSTQNPNGIVGGNFMQLIFGSVEGQDSGKCAFTEKMRSFPIIRGASNYKKKVMSGTWGSVIKMPGAISSMLGI